MEPYTKRIITNHSQALVNSKLICFHGKVEENPAKSRFSSSALVRRALKGPQLINTDTHLCSSTRNRISNFLSIILPSPILAIVTRIFSIVGSSLINEALITWQVSSLVDLCIFVSNLVIEILSKKKKWKTVSKSD